jgi:hypothetical protein
MIQAAMQPAAEALQPAAEASRSAAEIETSVSILPKLGSRLDDVV